MDDLNTKLLSLSPEQRLRLEQQLAEKGMILDPSLLNESDTSKTITCVGERDHYPLSAAQKRMFVASGLDDGGTAYNVTLAFRIEGPLDRERLERSFRSLIARHDALRSYFPKVADEPVQRVASDIDFRIEFRESIGESIAEVARGFVRPYDFEVAPLIRARLVKIGAAIHYLLIDTHHIVSDGHSVGIMLGEISALYRGDELAEPGMRYVDYSVWQDLRRESVRIAGQKSYWQNVFPGEIPTLAIPTDFPRLAVRSYGGGRIRFSAGEALSSRLEKVARECGATVFMALVGAFSLLLSAHSGQDDVVVGTPFAGRTPPELTDIIGVFINNIALRTNPRSGITMREFLHEIRQRTLEAFENQDFQFEDIVHCLGIARDPSRNPLFDAMLVLNPNETTDLELNGAVVVPIALENATTKLDLTMNAFPDDEGLSFELEYNTGLFERRTAERFSSRFLSILSELVENPGKRLDEFEVMNKEETTWVLHGFNDTAVEYPREKTVCGLFCEQAEKTPSAVAVEEGEQRWSYRDLNLASDALAARLANLGVDTGCVVGLMAERSWDAIVGIFAIMKSGAAYLPIDPEYPEDRIAYILEDSDARWVVAMDSTATRVAGKAKVIMVGASTKEGPLVGPREDHPENPAYVIYTSGSTGKPKGTVISHRALVNYSVWANKTYVRGETLVFPLYSSLSFDLTLTSLFTPLISGNAIVVYRGNADENLIERIVSDNRVDIIKLTPTHLSLMREIDLGKSRIRRMIVGGEDLPKRLAAIVSERYRGEIEIYNEYGPTEATVGCMVHKYDPSDTGASVPIGKPVDNVRIYILGRAMKPVPSGAVGEIYIAGDGLAEGYLRKPDLTAERFLPDPFVPGGRMYRSGDLGRMLDDQTIEYAGRIDSQIKLRGFRVELGEIEARMAAVPRILEAVVVLRTDKTGDRYLAAYFTSENEMGASDIKAELSKTLPDYMVPSRFKRLDSIPHSANGKVDRKALPDAEVSADNGFVFQPPSTVTERKLAAIWSEILGVEKIGIDDNFFDLGGHSLKATTLISKIHREFDVEILLRDAFRKPQIRQLSQLIEKGRESKFFAIGKTGALEHYPLSAAQKRMYVLAQLERGGTHYNTPFAFDIEGPVDRNAMESAFFGLIMRHESLRTSFPLINDAPCQVVSGEPGFILGYSEMDETSIPAFSKDFVQPFDLAKPPLLRAHLAKTGEERYVLLIDTHHILFDGISMGVMIRDLSALYEGRRLAPPKLQYRDFSAWQEAMLLTDRVRSQELYWEKTLAGDLPSLNMPTDYPRPSVLSFDGDRVVFGSGLERASKLRGLAAVEGTTLYMVLLSAFSIALAKYSGQDEILVGSPIAGRRHDDLKDVIGIFVNTLVIRCVPSAEKTYRDFLGEVKETALGAFENQDFQFETLVETLNLKRDMSRNPLFDVILVMQESGGERRTLAGSPIKSRNVESGTAKVDITLSCSDGVDGIEFILEFRTALFKRETAERLLSHFINLLDSITLDPGAKISEMDMLSTVERSLVIGAFNATGAEYSRGSTVHSLFEERVRLSPERVALEWDGGSLTYRQLNDRANRLANVLRDKGALPDGVIAVMAGRSPEMVVGILAVLKSGCAYLPIDPTLPAQRVEFLIRDSQAMALLTQRKHTSEGEWPVDTLLLDDEASYGFESGDLVPLSGPKNLAYVIYTSGSTGMPKGVMVEHGNVVNIILALQRKYPLGKDDAFLLKTTFSFDVSVSELFGFFHEGGRLVVLEEGGERDPGEILRAIENHRITHINFAPSMFGGFVDGLKPGDGDRLAVLKYVFVAGEAFPGDLASRFFAKAGDKVRLENLYGPTEATVYATGYSVGASETRRSVLPIGNPFPNTRAYVLDRGGRPQAIGVPGELYLAGDGLARGYLNRPELTEASFFPAEHVGESRLYRTGDLTRRLPDGSIEYLGRIDQQVKIRGYRIEPGEIESRLMRHEGVREAAVVVRKDLRGDDCLCAFYVSYREILAKEIRDFLGETLPEYMVPPFVSRIETLPHTPSGKIDRKAFPSPSVSVMTGRSYAAPENEAETTMLEIWADVLHEVEIGIDDDFFDLGGHSLTAISLASKIYRELGIDIPLKEVFAHPTIRSLSERVREMGKGEFHPILPAEKFGTYPMSSAQGRMYLFQLMDPDNLSYNMPEAYSLTGPLDRLRLEEALRKLASRHETLRTSFGMVDGAGVQLVSDEVAFPLVFLDAEEFELKAIALEFVRAFDLASSPLAHAMLVRHAPERHTLLIDTHHIISDGSTARILLRDLAAFYRGESLPELTIQYKDFAVWQKGQLDSENMTSHRVFWQSEFSGELPVLNMPVDRPRGARRERNGSSVRFSVPAELTECLESIARKEKVTLNAIVHAIYSILLHKHTRQTDFVVGTIASGRTHPDAQDMAGVFINFLPVPGRVDPSSNIADFIKATASKILSAFGNQDYPFEKILEDSGYRKDASRNPLMETMIDFHSEAETRLRLEAGGMTIEGSGFPLDTGTTDLDFWLDAKKADSGELSCFIRYRTDLFDESTVETLARHFINIAEAVARNPNATIVDINPLGKEESARVIDGFNATGSEYRKMMTLPDLLEERVRLSPERLAIRTDSETITYAALNAAANRMAHELRSRGIGPESVVGIVCERSARMLVGLWGILKSGGAYVPIAPDYPSERIEFILADSGAEMVIVGDMATKLGGFAGTVISLDDECLSRGADFNPLRSVGAENLAYMIYTSGSTGKPKGVMTEHRNVVAYIHAFMSEFSMCETDVMLQQNSFTFDAFVEEVFASHSCGACVAMPKRDEIPDSRLLREFMERQGVTMVSCSPLLLNEINRLPPVATIHTYISGGDVMKPEYVSAIARSAKVYNTYGPTETTVCATYRRCDNAMEPILPIGKPIANYRVYILDDHMNPVPIKVSGEICIAGPGVARGYRERPELNAASFVPDPFKTEERMFRTGDQGRWRNDGNVEFLGRKDNQVKIRGFRIELGEIEDRLLAHPEVSEAVAIVLADHSSDPAITAYFSARKPLALKELRSHVAETLPAYMMPASFMQLEGIPRTAHGKIDRKALPKPDPTANSGKEYVAPAEGTESVLAGIWSGILGLDRVGRDDDFFEQGGHSLKAAALVSRLQKELSVNLPLRAVFDNPTLSALSALVAKSRPDSLYRAIDPAPCGENHVVSPAQKRMYIVHQLDASGTGYNISGGIVVEGELDRGRVERAFEALVARHEALRTSFELQDGVPVQRVHDGCLFRLEVSVSSGMDPLKLADEFVRPFDISGDKSLFRAKIAELGPGRSLILFDVHHIVADGISLSVLMREFKDLYEDRELPSLRLQYKDYAHWQARLLATERMKAEKAYWLGLFSETIPVLRLPCDFPRPPVQSFEGDSVSFSLGGKAREGLEAIASETGATLYMAMLALFTLLLSKYSGQDDIVVGSPIAGRPHADLESVVGMFVNTLALRNFPRREITFREFLSDVRESSLKAYEYQNYQFEDLVEKLAPPRDLSRSPLFDAAFVLQNIDSPDFSLRGLRTSPLKLGRTTSKFDLTLIAVPSGDDVELELEYCSRLFRKETIRRMASHFLNLAESAIAAPDTRLVDLGMMSGEELSLVTREFVGRAADYPKEMTLHALFEEQVLRFPENIAVQHGNRSISYRGLDTMANGLAARLRDAGLTKGGIVALSARQSIETIVAIFGILKAGGAYMPIDPGFPENRRRFMVEDSGAKIMVADDVTGAAYPGIVVISPDAIPFPGNGEIFHEEKGLGEDLAQVMYTSGSTGKPKGNFILHRGISRIAKASNYIEVTERDTVLQLSNYAFDGSTFDIFAALLNGAKLVLVDKEKALDIDDLAGLIRSSHISVFFVTTALFNTLVDTNVGCLDGVRKVLFGGERVSFPHAKKAFERLGTGKIVHMYGPTESTVFATFHPIDSVDERLGTVPIGKPLSNTVVFVLDEEGNPSPVGIPGELYISGDGLARGYLNRPGLNAEKFVPNPLLPGERAYRTGDLVKWMPDGAIEFMGRIDQQVKFRGFRIEMGEIETSLLQVPGIGEAVVIARNEPNRGMYLCAYLVGADIPEGSELKRRLAADLPEYMIPSHFIILPSIPLTPNGKVDKNSLPEPEGRSDLASEYRPPRNAMEIRLVAIWERTLGRDKIGIDDNFFDLGGHSLKAISLISAIQKELGAAVPLGVIFKSPTIEKLAEALTARTNNDYDAISKAEPREDYPLSPSQLMVFMQEQVEGIGTAYLIPLSFCLEGKIDAERLELALRVLIGRHDTLRTSFHFIDGAPIQRVETEVPFSLERLRMDESELEKGLPGLVSPFDLASSPLLKAFLVETGKNRHILMMVFHHIAVDGVSLGILLGELSALYKGVVLSDPSLQYGDFVIWREDFVRSGAMTRQEKYWERTLFSDGESGLPLLAATPDFTPPEKRSFRGKILVRGLDADTVSNMERFARESQATMNNLLFAVYALVLSKRYGQDDIVVGSVVSGRNREETQRIVGMFNNFLPIRIRLSSDTSFLEYLESVKSAMTESYENGDFPYHEIVSKLKTRVDNMRNPLFDTMLIFHNQMDPNEGFELDGLRVEPCRTESQTAKLYFKLDIFGTRCHGLDIALEYNTDLFSVTTMEKLMDQFVRLLGETVGHPSTLLGEFDLLGPEEKRELLVETGRRRVGYPRESTIHGLFEAQVRMNPDGLAVTFGGKDYSYSSIETRANRLGNYLREIHGIGPESLVGILMDKSDAMIVAALAVLKAGGAYVPMDPDYPLERLRDMAADAKVSCILIGNRQIGLLRELKEGCGCIQGAVCLDREVGEDGLFDGLQSLAPYADSRPESGSLSANAAYVIYTSGSTGKPKGAVLEHRNVVSLLFNDGFQFDFSGDDVWTMFHSFSFDFSVWEMYGALLRGGRLVVLPKETARDTAGYLEVLKREKVTVLNQTPTAFYQLALEDGRRMDGWTGPRWVIFGGEALQPGLLADWKTRHPETKIVNMYGITETTVHVTFKEIGESEIAGNVSNIGKAIPSLSVYIMDNDLNLMPTGLAGELCVAGDGVCRGYLNRTELTAVKFVPNPRVPGERIYRSGDLARRLENGDMEYLGRMDQQVKIRGHRIELGEIESHLVGFKGIEQAVVVARTVRNDSCLCAYFTFARKNSETSAAPSVRELRAHLGSFLPEYMIPSYFTPVERIPITSNGKVDKSCLPVPGDSIETGTEYSAPTTTIEATLAVIWCDLLGLEQVGIDDNFFNLGGHSLKVTVLAGRIKKELGVEISLREIFKNLTIRELSVLVSRSDSAKEFSTYENLVLLRKGLDRSRNVFFIHDGSGDIGGYLELCGSTDPSRYCWGLKLDRNAPENITVESLAREYLERIRSVQPDGPYYLVGWSYGGSIAFEIGRVLRAKSESVGLLALIDPSFPRGKQGLIEDHGYEDPYSSETDFLEAMIPGLAKIVSVWDNRESLKCFAIDQIALTKLPLSEVKDGIPRGIARIIPNFAEAGIEDLVEGLFAVRTIDKSVQRYAVGAPLDARACIIMAKDSGYADTESLSGYFLRVPSFHEIAGDHFSIMEKPLVFTLAAILNEELNRFLD